MKPPQIIGDYEVIGVSAMITFNDDPKKVQRRRYISFGACQPDGTDGLGKIDSEIFDYAEDLAALKLLQKETDDKDYVVVYFNLELRELAAA